MLEESLRRLRKLSANILRRFPFRAFGW